MRLTVYLVLGLFLIIASVYQCGRPPRSYYHVPNDLERP